MSERRFIWRLSAVRSLPLDRPRLMAILNLTPDSFSDGGEIASMDDAVRAAAGAIQSGADLLDVGGESTRPGAAPVSAQAQIARTIPAISAIRASLGDGFGITIDTTLAPVAKAALDAGADAINDTSAGRDDPGMLPLAARRGVGIVLMHRLVLPRSDRYSTDYAQAPDYSAQGGVVSAASEFLRERSAAAVQAGVPRDGLVLDPGLGFGKSVSDNLALIEGTPELASLGFPILSGLSRKSFTVRAAGLPDSTPPRGRVQATVELSLAHFRAGASIFRVHDVAAHAAAFGSAHR